MMLYIGMMLTSAVCAGLASAIWLYADGLKTMFGDKDYSMVGQSLACAMAFNAIAIWADDWQTPARVFASEYQSLPDIVAGFIGGMMMLVVVLCMVMICFGGYVLIKAICDKKKDKNVDGKKEVVRGQQIKTKDAVATDVRNRFQVGELKIGGVPIPRDMENRGIVMAGVPGSGKSVAINNLLDAIRARGDRAIILDSSAQFLERHYRDGDVILNPFDKRDPGWSCFSEIAGPWEAENIAQSIRPNTGGESGEWAGYAQNFIAAAVERLMKVQDPESAFRIELDAEVADIGEQIRLLGESDPDGEDKATQRALFGLRTKFDAIQAVLKLRADNRSLFEVAFMLDIPVLQVLFKGTTAQPQVADGNERTFGSIRNVVGTALRAYNRLGKDHGKDAFSIKRWVREGKDGSCLFLTYDDEQLAALKHLMSCQIDVACRAINSLTPSRSRRIWLIADEFASLGQIGTLGDYMAKSRKFGGCSVVGFQTVSQVRDNYGDQAARTIMNSLTHSLVLRVGNDEETQKFMSAVIGDAEIRLTTVSRTASENSSTTTSVQHKVERAVMGSELTRLPDCVGYLNLAGDIDCCKVTLPFPPDRKPAADCFVLRDFAAEEREEAELMRKLKTTPSPVVSAPAASEPKSAEVTSNPFPAAASNPFALNK